MTRPRCSLISLPDTPWYHLVSRCVRRAFLCGHDTFTGQDYEHRRAWVESRIRELASVFAIDVAAYAVMSNHYHVVVRVDADCAAGWSADEVLRRWLQLFTGPVLVQHYLVPTLRAQMGDAEIDKVLELVETYRARLFDVSWYMRVLNESIARQANAEDGVTGRFWEGRFKSQALLDEQALLAVMAYVDLNPIRAGIAESPEDSVHTSIAVRLTEMQAAAAHVVMAAVAVAGAPPGASPVPTAHDVPLDLPRRDGRAFVDATAQAVRLPTDATVPSAVPSAGFDVGLSNIVGAVQWDHMRGDSAASGAPILSGGLQPERVLASLPEARLMPFDPTGQFARAIPFGLEEYFDLVDTMGRVAHPKKRGAVPHHLPPILQRLGIDAQAFIDSVDTFFGSFAQAVGTPASLAKLACARQQRAMRGMASARKMLCAH